MNTVTFSLFADLHHYPGVFFSRTPEHLFQIQQRAMDQKSDFILHLGDLTHQPHLCGDFIGLYDNFTIPSHHCLGNHDTDGTPFEEALRCYHLEKGYYCFDVNGFRMIVLDPNYLYENGVYTHYSLGNYYGKNAVCEYIPPEQLGWLREVLLSSPYPCCLFSHQSLEREADGVKNLAAVRGLIAEANRVRPGAVLLAANGHLHRDNLRIVDNVCYLDLNSASFDWVEKEHNCYPEELNRQYSRMNHIVAYEDPIHAVVTLSGDGTIAIEGMESRMFMDVTREMTGNKPLDAMGRPVVPRVSSAKIRIL